MKENYLFLFLWYKKKAITTSTTVLVVVAFIGQTNLKDMHYLQGFERKISLFNQKKSFTKRLSQKSEQLFFYAI